MSRSKAKDHKFFKRVIKVSSIAVILLVAAFYLVMTRSGHWLVDNDEFQHVKWAVVLDGQSADMERTDFAANLMVEGKIDSVVILGRRILRNRNNAEFYIEDFLQQGDFDENAIFIAPHDDPSTIGEACTILPWLLHRKADTVLLITSAYATHRVKRIFSRLSSEPVVFLTVDIRDKEYKPEIWYANRESRKNWLREWAAYANSFIDLWSMNKLTEADSVFFKSISSVSQFNESRNPVVNLQDLLPKVQEKMEEVSADSTTIPADSTKSKEVPVSSDSASQAPQSTGNSN